MSLYHDFSTTVQIISAKSIRTLQEKRSPEVIRWLYSSLKVFFLTRARDSWLLLTLALIFFLSQADTWSSVSVEGVNHFFVDCRVNRAIMKVKWLAKSYLWIQYFPRGWREGKCHSFSLLHPRPLGNTSRVTDSPQELGFRPHTELNEHVLDQFSIDWTNSSAVKQLWYCLHIKAIFRKLIFSFLTVILILWTQNIECRINRTHVVVVSFLIIWFAAAVFLYAIMDDVIC